MTGGRERILKAALECFSRDGVAATSLSRLREAAGVSPGSFYHHFPGKEDVTAALFTQIIDGYHQEFLAELRRDPDPARTVRGVVAFHLAWCRAHPAEARFLFTERPPDDGDLRESNQAFFAEVIAWWRTHSHHGALLPVDLTTAYVLWLGPAQELARMWLSGQVREPSPDQIAALGEAAWRCLGADARAEA